MIYNNNINHRYYNIILQIKSQGGDKMRNADIKNKLKEAKIFQWQLADKLLISEMSLVRKLRYELPQEEKQKILKIIEELATENNNKNN